MELNINTEESFKTQESVHWTPKWKVYNSYHDPIYHNSRIVLWKVVVV